MRLIKTFKKNRKLPKRFLKVVKYHEFENIPSNTTAMIIRYGKYLMSLHFVGITPGLTGA